MTGLVELFVAFTLPWSAATCVMLFISGGCRWFWQFCRSAISAMSMRSAPIPWIGISFVFQGISGVAAGMSERQTPGRGWDIVLCIISVISVVIVLSWPFDSIDALTIVTGMRLVISGVARSRNHFRSAGTPRPHATRSTQCLSEWPHSAGGSGEAPAMASEWLGSGNARVHAGS